MKGGPSPIWRNWLFVVSIANILAGLLIALAPDSPLFAMHTSALAETFYGGPLPAEAAGMRTFFFGIIGGTIAGYFLLQVFIVIFPFSKGELWAWHAIFWAITLWFVIDSSLSIWHGAFFNVWMINLWSYVLHIIPLVMTWKAFRVDQYSISPDVQEQ